MMPTTATWPADVFVLIPSYKAALSLEPVLMRLQTVVSASNLCVVDDASVDGTPMLCERLGIHCIVHPENMGKGAALTSGFTYLAHEPNVAWVLTMDADGQHAPEDIPQFFEAMRSNPDAGIIIGARELSPKKMPWLRVFSNTLTSGALSILCGCSIIDSQSGFRLYNTRFLRKVHCVSKRFEMESEILLRAASLHFPVIFVKVQTLYFNGNSHIVHIKDTLRWIKAVTHVWIQLKLHRNYE
jgi:glycosyltransferase involved in cell wall biosynthesis